MLVHWLLNVLPHLIPLEAINFVEVVDVGQDELKILALVTSPEILGACTVDDRIGGNTTPSLDYFGPSFVFRLQNPPQEGLPHPSTTKLILLPEITLWFHTKPNNLRV